MARPYRVLTSRHAAPRATVGLAVSRRQVRRFFKNRADFEIGQEKQLPVAYPILPLAARHSTW
jgi:hypothetical protein